jgi:catechol 2,3-dioxygenase-like lactoylglutathione lyase family enzyme
MRVNGICIVTDDVARLRAFYADALRAEADGDDTFTAFRIDGAALSLFSAEGMERMAPGSTDGAGVGRNTLEIEVDDVDIEFERLQRLDCTVVKPPTTQAWGRRSVWVRDPDGNIVNFYATVPSAGG